MFDRGLWAIVPAQRRVDVDAVGEQPVVGGERAQAVGRAGVGGVLADVDVDADAEVPGQPDDRVERVVRQGEAGVRPDQAPAPGPQEPLVLGQAGLGPVGAVAVGDLVGAHHPDADLGAGLGDDVEAAVDRGGGGVVVDDGGRARLERLDRAEQRRPAHELEVEGQVEPPPHLVEDLREVGGRGRRRRHAPGERGVEVVVRADEPGGGGRHDPERATELRRNLRRSVALARRTVASSVGVTTVAVTSRSGASGASSATRRRGPAGRRPPRPPSARGRSRRPPSPRTAPWAGAARPGRRRPAARPWPAGCRAGAASWRSGGPGRRWGSPRSARSRGPCARTR